MSSSLSRSEIHALAGEAFTYLYPLVTMDITRAQLTDGQPKDMHGDPNAFAHVRTFPAAEFRDVVRPNFDTLYSSAWFDLTDGPVIIRVPDSGGRYYLLPLLDMWTDVFSAPGARTTGTGAQSLVLTPPGWAGEVPDECVHIPAPTVYVWAIGRTQTNGPADFAAVNAFQDDLRIERIDGGDARVHADIADLPSGIDMTQEPLTIVNTLSAVDFFAYAMRLLKVHPPHLTDGSVLARIRRIGITPGEDFDPSRFSEDELVALGEGVRATLQSYPKYVPLLGKMDNGWALYTTGIGVYGNDYLKRAVTAFVGLGANQPEDAVYPVNVRDAAGELPVGENDYVIHFEAEHLPPVDAFWSLTMYDAEGFQVANELNRFAIGDRDPLVYNADGSLDIYIQHRNPGPGKETNWLPSPLGLLGMTLRLYAPKPSVLTGEWHCPPLVRVSEFS
ncbi:DUF1254 domain-containing protein [Agromyces soli]